MSRVPSRLAAIAAAVPVLTLCLAVVAQQPALAFQRRPGPARAVNFPLRHDFSMAVGLPGHGLHEPTSCYDVHNGEKEYVCRIVAGVEETGDPRTFFLAEDEVLSKGSEPTFAGTLVDRDGIQYEGCAWLDKYWGCDYATRRQVSGWHYEQGHYVLNVFVAEVHRQPGRLRRRPLRLLGWRGPQGVPCPAAELPERADGTTLMKDWAS